jgi:leucyl/phenylalanyl-tRNA--protein transferase
MPIASFPDPRKTGPDGIVAFGGDLHPLSLELAYGQGIFPWPIEGLPLAWFCPPERAILEFSELHVPRSLAKERRRTHLRCTIDQDFEGVIQGCADTARPGQDGTWITDFLMNAYVEYHRFGRAHSVETWHGDRLVGGIYGVETDGAFGAESMFYTEPYASKLALLHLIDHLRARGLDWMDIQVMTPHMKALGARVVPRNEFLRRLARTRVPGRRLFEEAP